jgi:2-polyprenyl-3-methyl-5-hydroxy-6-metoxy-1,4-benzoquinol methylase
MTSDSVEETIDDFARTVYLTDTTGENWIENIIHGTNLPRLLERLLPAEAGEPILEMGFGEGTITEPLLRAGYRVHVVEGSPELCAAALSRFGDRGLIVHNSFFERFDPPHRYANVLCLHVLEHVDDPAVVVRQVLTWLRPGGQTIAVVPNAQSFHRQLAVTMGIQPRLDSLSPRDLKVGHRRVLTLDQLVGLFESAGFEVVDTFGYFLKIVPDSMMVEWPHDLIRALVHVADELPPHLLSNVGLVARRP